MRCHKLATADSCVFHLPPDELLAEKERYKNISDELDQTFAELAGYWGAWLSLSHLHISSPLTPLLFICKTHCKFVYQTKKSLYNSSLLPVYFGVCVWSDQLTKTSKKIYELFFVVAYTCHLFVQREVCIERASFEPAKSCFWYYLDHRSPSHSCVSAGKVMTIEAGNIRMTGSFSYLNICYSFVSADVWKKKGLTSPFWFS